MLVSIHTIKTTNHHVNHGHFYYHQLQNNHLDILLFLNIMLTRVYVANNNQLSLQIAYVPYFSLSTYQIQNCLLKPSDTDFTL